MKSTAPPNRVDANEVVVIQAHTLIREISSTCDWSDQPATVWLYRVHRLALSSRAEDQPSLGFTRRGHRTGLLLGLRSRGASPGSLACL